MKPVLMIHDFKAEYLSLPLEDYILTFDDGLVTPLRPAYWREIKAIPTEKIFFIPTHAIGHGMEGRGAGDFMTLEELQNLSQYEDVIIGGHSHSHRRLSTFKSFTDSVIWLIDDTETMCKWFHHNLGFHPTHFCYPYNETNGVYEAIVREQFKIKNIYGAERKDIEELL